MQQRQWVDEAIKMRDAGASYSQIARTLGKDRRTITNALDEDQHRKHLEKKKRYRERHRQELRDYMKRYRREHLDDVVARSAKWKKDNKEMARESVRAWKKSHMGRVLSHNASRRATIKAALCPQEKDEIAAVYSLSRSDSEIKCYLCGATTRHGGRHVDHKTPLSRDGLHSIANLGIACSICNSRKWKLTVDEFYAKYQNIKKPSDASGGG